MSATPFPPPIRRRSGNQEALASALAGRAFCNMEQYRQARNYAEVIDSLVLPALRSEESIRRGLGDRLGLAECLGNQARAFVHQDELEDALTACQESESICRQAAHEEGLVGALRSKGMVFARAGDWGAAGDCLQEAEEICRKSNLKLVLREVRGLQAEVYGALGKEDLAREAREEESTLLTAERLLRLTHVMVEEDEDPSPE